MSLHNLGKGGVRMFCSIGVFAELLCVHVSIPVANNGRKERVSEYVSE